MPRTIIVPLDTSPGAEAALPVAEALARRIDGELLLLSVIEAPSEFAVWLRAEETIDAWVDHHIEVDRYLTGIADGFSGLLVETSVTTGNPAPEIADAAGGYPEPVIVMVSHARTGLERLAIGNVAAAVLHNVACPVIVVRASEEAAEPRPVESLDRLLVALDGSEFAEQALEQARAVLGASGLTIHLVRVVETSKWYGSTNVGLDFAAQQMYVEAGRETASEYLEAAADRLRQAGNDVTWEVDTGLVAERINEAAAERDAGLIVMSTHGRTGLGRVFIGSVAERVIQHADRPVFLVHPDTYSTQITQVSTA